MSADDNDDFERSSIPDFLRDPVGTVRRHWFWMLVSWAIGLTATIVFVMFQKPMYESTATVLVTSQQIREDLVRSTVQEDSFQRINALINSLLSLNTLSTLIERFDLYPGLRNKLTLAEISAQMREHVTIEAQQGLGSSKHDSARVYSITYENSQPEVAADVANALAGQFTDESIRMRTQQASLATSFLKSELHRAESALREQNTAIRAFKELNRGELPGDLQANLMRLDRLQQQRLSLARQITEAENRNALISQTASAAGSPLTSPEQRLQALRAQLQAELEKYTEEHPSIIALRATIERQEARLAAAPSGGSTGSAIPSVAAIAIAGLRGQLASTETALAKLDTHVTRTPARQEELSALEERETVLRENYLSFLRKVQEAELAQSLETAQQGARFSIGDRAMPSSKPTQARVQFFVIGVLLSLAFSGAIGLLREALDPVLVSKEQIESIGTLRVLGSAPRLS